MLRGRRSLLFDLKMGIWRFQHGVEIINIGKNLFQFQFHHWKDKEKILEEQP